MAVLNRGSLFPPTLIPELLNITKGESALAKMSDAKPIAFNGQTEFTFSLDSEIDVVAESGAKGPGGASVTAKTITPIKVEYSARVSDEFMYASEEYRMDVLRSFAEGFARKMASGMDLMAMHGVNPRTGQASAVIGENNFDSVVTGNVVTISSADTPDANIEAAIALVQADGNSVDGLIMAPAFKASLAAMVAEDGRKLFPELAWGNNPGVINGLRTETSANVSANGSLDRAIVGDFRRAFKWGIAKEIPLEVIEYGNPDNDTVNGDLKGHNQVLLRCEAYVGWAILNPEAFALIKATE